MDELINYTKKLQQVMWDKSEEGAMKTLLLAFQNAYLKSNGDDAEQMIDDVKTQLDRLMGVK